MSNGPQYVTAATAGISERYQINIALELILSQGGIATMQQIYDAVEERLDNNIYLSDQGKHSLRRIINTSAVDQEYIHPYDDDNPGWRITEVGVEFIREELAREIGSVKATAEAYVNFLLALKELRDVLNSYDTARTELNLGRGLEVIKKTGIILIITAWETFIEDILELYVDYRLRHASSSYDVRGIINTIAQNWYNSILTKQDNRPMPPDFIKWTDDGWKQIVRDKLREDLRYWNTPSSNNIRDLSTRYVGRDVTESWRWPGMSSERACVKLDELITLRGEVVHRTGSYFEIGSSVRRRQVEDSIDFVDRLAARTETAISDLL